MPLYRCPQVMATTRSVMAEPVAGGHGATVQVVQGAVRMVRAASSDDELDVSSAVLVVTGVIFLFFFSFLLLLLLYISLFPLGLFLVLLLLPLFFLFSSFIDFVSCSLS